MADGIENTGNISPDLANEDAEQSRAEVENSTENQGVERKARFFVENDLESILEQSQSIGTKRNTKWVVKLFQGKKLLLCFEFSKAIKQNDVVINLLKRRPASSFQVISFHKKVRSFPLACISLSLVQVKDPYKDKITYSTSEIQVYCQIAAHIIDRSER